MATDWLKIRVDLADDPVVMEMADTLKIEPEQVVGHLVRVWGWAGAQSVDGHVSVTVASRKCHDVNVTLSRLDRVARLKGVGDAMVASGWLRVTEEGVLVFPDWDRYLSKSSRERSLALERQRKSRSRSCHKNVTVDRDKSVTREEKRRSIRKTPTESSASSNSSTKTDARKSSEPDVIWDAVCAAFSLTPTTKADRSRIGKVIRDLKAKGATPDEIARLHAGMRRKWTEPADGKPFGPEALVKWWDQRADFARWAADTRTLEERLR